MDPYQGYSDYYQDPSAIDASTIPPESQYGSTAPYYSQSQAPSTSPQAADDTSTSSSFLPVLLCAVFLGILALVGFLALGSLGSDSDGADDFGPGGDGGGGGGGGSVGGGSVGGGNVGGDGQGITEAKGSSTEGDAGQETGGGGTDDVGRSPPPVATQPEPPVVENTPPGPVVETQTPPVGKPSPPVTMEPTTTVTEKTTTTVAENEKAVKLLVCTVGAAAVMASMYPSDGLCDYIFYTYIALAGDVIISSTNQRSWTVFQERAKGYKTTGAGVALDYPYITPDLIKQKKANTLLEGLAHNNMPHYGLLNVMAQDQKLVDLLPQASTVIKELKKIQASDKARMTVIALGMYNYTQMSSWNIYQNVLKKAVQETEADIVIAISSTSMTLNQLDECIVIPPLPIKIKFRAYPSLERFAPLVAVSFPYTKRTAIVGLSMEMAVVTFHLQEDGTSPIHIIYSKCISAALGSADVICPGDRSLSSEHASSTLAGFVQDNSKRIVFMADNDETIEQKVTYIKKLKLRSRFAWLLYNVHLTDIEGRCLLQTHSRIANLKTLLE